VPTYVYRGLETGVIFEVEQRMIEAPLTQHPETGEPVSRMIQATGIVFKGSGFYKTDSRNSSGASKPAADASKASDSSESKPSSSSESKSSGGGDSAPASTSEPKASSTTESKPSSPSETKSSSKSD
jgi:putative FmdB family regulatory protein